MENIEYTIEKKHDKKSNKWDFAVRFEEYHHIRLGLTKKEVDREYNFFDGVFSTIQSIIKNNYTKIVKDKYDTKAIAEECRKR